MGKLENKVKTANANMKKSFIAGGDAVKHLTKRIIGLARRVLIFSVIAVALNHLKETVQGLFRSDEELQSGLEDLRTALWTAFAPIYDVILPAVKTLVSWLTQVVTILVRFYALITGKNFQALVARGKQLEKTSKAYGKNTKAVKKNTKAMEESLAPFDKINVLQQNKPADTGGGGGVPSAKPDTSILKDTVSDTLVEVTSILGGFLFALGVILVVMGQIPLGLGFMIAGATIFAGSMAVGINSSELKSSTQSTLAQLVPVIAGFLGVLGVILLVTGHIPLGLGFLIAGFMIFAGVAVATMKSETTKQEIKNKLGEMVTIVTPLLAILGVMLIITGHLLLGLGFLIADFALFGITYASANDSTKELMLIKLQQIAGILAPYVAILGVILLVSGHFGLGLAMLIAGAGLFVVGKAGFNGESIVNYVKSILNKIKFAVQTVFNQIRYKIQMVIYDVMCFFRKMGNFFITIINKMLGGVGGLVNKAIRLLKKLPNTEDLRYVNWQLSYIPMPRVPALARGAVISGGKPFLAMLGDQPSGQTNVEAPLSTIQQAVAEVMATQKAEQPIVLELDGRELGRAVIDTSRREMNRIGVNMIVGEA